MEHPGLQGDHWLVGSSGHWQRNTGETDLAGRMREFWAESFCKFMEYPYADAQ